MVGFDGCLKDYEGARGDAQQAIDAVSQCKDSQQREERIVEARNCVEEVERYIRLLENEVKETKDGNSKRQLDTQVRHCHTQHAGLKSSLEKVILIGDARKKAADAPADSDQKTEAVRYAERLDRNGRRLDEAQRTLAETEAIAVNTANNLLQQRNQLQHTQLNVDQAQQDTQEAKGHLRRLTVKALTNKIVLVIIMLVLAAAIVLVSYYRWYPRDKKDVLGILPTPTPTTVAPTPTPST